LIKDKIQKEIDKIVHDWPNEGIRVEKARWGRHNIIKGKIKVELAKNVDAQNLTIEDVKAIIDKQKAKKTSRKSSRNK
jgi:DNA topoisomerase-1